MVLFPTDHCNLDCFFCYTEAQRKIAAELDWDVLHRTLDEGVKMGVKGVSFGGGGEPLIYKKIGPLLDFIHEHNLSIDSIKSNGTAITAHMADRLVRAGLRNVTVSLNETEPDAYAKMNQCSPRLYDAAMRGIHELVAAKRRLGTATETSVQLFIWRENYRQLLEKLDKLLATGTDLVYVNTMDQLPKDQYMNDEQRAEFAELVREAMRRSGRQLRLNLTHEGLERLAQEMFHTYGVVPSDQVLTPNRIEYCYIGWYSPVVAANGDIYPCCHFSADQGRRLGNLHDASLRDIWHGDPARIYRNEMRSLMLAEANPALMPRCTRFVDKLCMCRNDCAFNYYLASPEHYTKMHDWAESGPRTVYKMKRKIKNRVRKILDTSERTFKKLANTGNK
jgi:radical SAM protein with 4Fe4S-binding SPASM domain